MSKVNLYIVDIEAMTIDRLEELFYNNPQLGIKVAGSSHNYISCINDIERVKEADVLLISAFLPDQMGIDLIANVKKVNPKAKVIIMVNKQTRNLADVSKSKGADDVIQKPFKAKALIDMIENLIDYEISDDDEQERIAYSYDSGTGEFTKREEEVLKPQEDPFNTFGNNDFATNNDGFNTTNNGFDTPNGGFENPGSSDLLPSMGEEPPQRRALFDIYSENPLATTNQNDKKEDRSDKPNQVVVFASTSSAGKTTMLVNVAAAIQKYSAYKPKICILDFNLLFPSVIYKLHQDDLIMSKRNLYDVVEDINSLDETLLKQSLVNHEPTGIKILETPSDVIRDFSRVNAESIEHLITYLRSMFDLVLIDTSSNIRDDATIFPLTVSDKAIVLMEPDLSSLLHTRKFISMMKVFENNLSEQITPKLNIVLNKENPKTGIHVDTIKKNLFNSDVKVQIPEDANITHLSNNGQFVIDKNTAATKAIIELSKMVYPFEKEFSLGRKKKVRNNDAGEREKHSSSLFGSLFKKKK